MKNLKPFLVLAVLSVAQFSCTKQNPELRFVDLCRSYQKLTEHYVEGIEDVSSGEEVALLLSEYADGVMAIAPEMGQFLNDRQLRSLDVDEARAVYDQTNLKLRESFLKLVGYTNDKRVQRAQIKLMESIRYLES